MPLQDATIESGCMQFVPWSNGVQPEVLPHHHINNDPRIHGLELDDLAVTKAAVGCPMPAGGATFHVMRTLHYSGPNLTAVQRCMGHTRSRSSIQLHAAHEIAGE